MKMISYIVIMAAVTYIIRALPIAVFRREIKSKWLKSFLYYIPYAVLGAMTFPAIFFSTGSVVSASIGFAAAFIAAFCDAGLTVTAVVSVIAAFLCCFIM